MGGSPGRSDDASGPDDVPTEEIEIVWLALESGYFEVPRRVSIAELAQRAGISDVEASRRLRRGVRHLLERSDYFRDRTQTRGGGVARPSFSP